MNAMDNARTHADDLRRSAEVYRQARAVRAHTPRRWRRAGLAAPTAEAPLAAQID